jgi:HEPN domain-containing protein
VPDALREASVLTIYASFGRYPGPTEDVSREQYEEAVQLAERVLEWAENVIRS